MKKDNDLFRRRNQHITDDYVTLDKQGELHGNIIHRLSEKYYLQPRTIYAVVSGEYDKRQFKKMHFKSA